MTSPEAVNSKYFCILESLSSGTTASSLRRSNCITMEVAFRASRTPSQSDWPP